MRFISKFIEALTNNVGKLVKEASDSLEISSELTALRVNGNVVVIDASKNKIIETMPDRFPNNPARAARAIQKKLKIGAKTINKKAIWTCGFRPDANRWVWYKDSAPIMTASLYDVYPVLDDTKQSDFKSASFGNRIINSIMEYGIEKAAKNISADVLENSFVEMKCACKSVDNYTIDDLVDKGRRADYESNFVICTSCNNLIKFS